MEMEFELDEDVLQALRAEMLRTGESMEQVANRVLLSFFLENTPTALITP
jgi:hypothetical protein